MTGLTFPDGWPDAWELAADPWGGADSLFKQKRWRRWGTLPVTRYSRRPDGTLRKETSREIEAYFTTGHCSGCGCICASMVCDDKAEWTYKSGAGYVDAIQRHVGWSCKTADAFGKGGSCTPLTDAPLACSDACEFKILVSAGISPDMAHAMTGLVDGAGELDPSQIPMEAIDRLAVENQRLRRLLAEAGIEAPPSLKGPER